MRLGDDIQLTLPTAAPLILPTLPASVVVPPAVPASPTVAPVATAQTATAPPPSVAQIQSAFPNLNASQAATMQSMSAQNPTMSLAQIATQFAQLFMPQTPLTVPAPTVVAPGAGIVAGALAPSLATLPIWVIPVALGGLALLLLSGKKR